MTTSAQRKSSPRGGDPPGGKAKLGLTTCGYCHAGNAADRRFCGECGKPLWEKCPACRVECRSGEAFCGGCGIHLREFFKQQVDDAETALAKASACESPAEINDAIRTLRSVRLADHRELTSLSERITAELSRLLQLVEQQTHDVEASLVRVRELFAASAFSDAVRLLEQLPKEFRTDESDRLLAEATAKQRETMALKAEIRAAIEKKQLLALAPKIERLLTLQPDAEGVRRLAGQLRDRLLVAANKKLAANEYDSARELVARVPACAIDENTKHMSERIAEFNWLANDLQLAPIIDPPLLEIAKRFAKQAPGDERNVERCRQLVRKAAEGTNSGSQRFPAVPWSTPPTRTHIGCAVDWLGGSERLSLSDNEVATVWKAEPGRYFIAAGLALQGIEIAAVNTNLHKVEKQGLLGQLTIGKRKETIKRAWGIDIGESSLKVVRLVAGSGDAGPVVDGCDLFPHSISLSRPEAAASRNRILAESLSAFLAKYPLEKSDRICVGFPGHKILGRSFQLPAAAPKKLEEMVRYEAQTRIPIPLDEAAWSFQSFTTSTSDGSAANSSSPANTLLIAAKQRVLQELLIAFDEVQMPLHIVQSDALALFNFAVYEGLGQLDRAPAGESACIALLDVGTDATNIVIVTGDRPWFRGFRRGGDDFTDAAVERLNLTKDQAEQVKFEPARVRRLSELYDAFDPMFARLTDEIQRSLESFRKETDQRVSHLLGVGGGFRLHGLLKYLRNGP